MDLRQALRDWFGNEQEGQPSAMQRASQRFQSGFDNTAIRARQRLPTGVVNALSQSGIPGWQGLRTARNQQDAADFGLEAPTQAPIANDLRAALRDVILPSAQQGVYASSSASVPTGVRRGVEPPDGPQGQSFTEQDNRAFLDARERARALIEQDGSPYLTDPSVQQAGGALAAAVDANRAARDEVARRSGITWDQWWHYRGRQDANAPRTAADANLMTRYRWGRAPRYEGAESRRPEPR